MSKTVSGVAQEIKQDISEIGVPEIEIGEKFNIKYEAFMEELVTILIQRSAKEYEPKVVVVDVNGINQPIVRGVPTKIKRKYLEVLARCYDSTYRQENRTNDPTKISEVITKVFAYPFTVIYDPNPDGQQWLESIVGEMT
jgi:hypothetical protein